VFRSLHMKLALILMLLMISIIAVVGTFLLNSVTIYYLDEFSDSMYAAFSEDAVFVDSLRSAADEENAPQALGEVLKAYIGNLGIDMENRNYYILDHQTGEFLAGSDAEGGKSLSLTPNILTAINGQVGSSRTITGSYIDIAVPIAGEEGRYIVYIRDNRREMQSLVTEIFGIILESLMFGMMVSVLLSFLLSKTMTTPIERLTRSARKLAEGQFETRPEEYSTDEIGTLTRAFYDMAGQLAETIGTVESERDKLNLLFTRMTDGVCAFSSDGELIQINLAAERMLGISEEEKNAAEPLTYSDIFPDGPQWSSFATLHQPDYREVELTRGGLTLQTYFMPYDDSGAGGGMVVIHDITEQTKLENVRREFVSNVSHELRTPLTNILSYTETLYENDDIDDETKRSFLGVIRNESERMSRIVSDLLTLSRFDYDNVALKMSVCSLAIIVERVCDAMRLEAQSRSQTLTLSLRGDLPDIPCDSVRIEQVLVNILSNAMKYTHDGGTVLVEAWADENSAFVAVTDNGVGIPKKDIDRLFERFYRVDKARSRAAGGSGLGLSIAKEIVDRHGGNITIDSEYGKGTKVTVRLPLHPETESWPVAPH